VQTSDRERQSGRERVAVGQVARAAPPRRRHPSGIRAGIWWPVDMSLLYYRARGYRRLNSTQVKAD
jgi:hypothetical protein